MPWNGSGGFSRRNGRYTGSNIWRQSDTGRLKIRGDEHDDHDQDLADGIAACLTKNGETSPTADIDFNAKGVTNARNAVADKEYAPWKQITDKITADITTATSGLTTPTEQTLEPKAFSTLVFAAAQTWDVAVSIKAIVTLTANMTSLTLSNTKDGGIYVLELRQDATGGKTWDPPAGWFWPGGREPVLSTAANAIDILTLMRVGNVFRAVLTKGFGT